MSRLRALLRRQPRLAPWGAEAGIPGSAPRVLLCFGDSNTHGSSPLATDGSWTRYGVEDRWPMRLAAHLGSRWHVVEEGLPGRTTVLDDPLEGAHKNGLRALPIALETHAPIDRIVVMLGTNDLKARFALPARDIAQGLRLLLDRIAASGAGPGGTAPAVLVVAPPPVRETGPLAETFAGSAEKSRRLAGLYAEIADDVGAAFFDAGTVAEVSPRDGIHLTPEGHHALATALGQNFTGRSEQAANLQREEDL